MGYREYFLTINKRKVNKIRNMNMEELLNFCKENNIEVEYSENQHYISIVDLLTGIGGKDVFSFGKWHENSKEIKKQGKLLFQKSDVQDYFHAYNVYIVDKNAITTAIEWQHKQIVEHFTTLALSDEEYHLKKPYDDRTREERLMEALNTKVMEWNNPYISGLRPYSLKEDRPIITSPLYEYSIFELVRIYKETNWNTNYLIFYGY